MAQRIFRIWIYKRKCDMLIPYIVQWLIKKLDGLDAVWRTEQRLKKERQRELFKEYVKNYMQK